MKGSSIILLLVLSSVAFAQTLADFIPPVNDVLLWGVGGILAAGAIGLLATTLAALVLPIPFIGIPLSFAIKFMAGQYQKWLTEQLPKLADQAWQATEAIAANAKKEGAQPAPTDKKEAALTILKDQAKVPSSRLTDLEAALEAAHTRNKAGGLELKQ